MADLRDYSVVETLRNGLAVTIRALSSADRERVAEAVRQLDRQSIYMRLFSYRNELTEAALDRIMRFDPEHEVVLVLTTGAGAQEKIIGSGRYVAAAPGAQERTAEIAFMVEEDYHGRGIAGRIFHHLAGIARAQGIATFEAEVLAENAGMRKVFARSGLPMRSRRDGGVVHISLSL